MVVIIFGCAIFLIAVELGNDSTLFRRELYFLKERKLFLQLRIMIKKYFGLLLHNTFAWKG
jgi:hypothetical protein